MAESYEREKLANAVGSLASAAPIQERLRYAFLAMHTMMAHGFTDEDRQAEFDSIIERLTSKGTAPETCAQLTNAEAEAVASDIVNLNTALNWNRVYELEEQIRELKTGG